MKRKEIMVDCPGGFEDELRDIVDYFEGKFGDIRDMLDINDISQINTIEEAYDLAKEIADDLY